MSKILKYSHSSVYWTIINLLLLCFFIFSCGSDDLCGEYYELYGAPYNNCDLDAIQTLVDSCFYSDFPYLNFGSQEWVDGHLVRLNLGSGDWSLFCEYPEEIALLDHLTHLNLDNTQISGLPHNMGNLTVLEDLSLNNNLITALPESIGELEYLKVLNSANNQLTALPMSITQLSSLEILRLDDNSLTSLPENIGQLSSLNYLDITNNQLSHLPEGICNIIDQLDSFYISDNQLCDPDNYPQCVEPYINNYGQQICE